MNAKPQRWWNEPEERELTPRELEQVDGSTAETPVEDTAPAKDSKALYAGLLNGLLDQIDDGIERALEHGLEETLRDRLAKVLPPRAETSIAKQTRRVERVIARGELAVRIANGINVLHRYERRQPAGATGDIGRVTAQTCIDLLLAALRQPAPESEVQT